MSPGEALFYCAVLSPVLTGWIWAGIEAPSAVWAWAARGEAGPIFEALGVGLMMSTFGVLLGVFPVLGMLSLSYFALKRRLLSVRASIITHASLGLLFAVAALAITFSMEERGLHSIVGLLSGSFYGTLGFIAWPSPPWAYFLAPTVTGSIVGGLLWRWVGQRG